MKPLLLESVAMAAKCSSTMTTDHMVHMRHHRGHRNAYANHRKSAVELLEASKGSYVKSREVLDHRQELKHPENLSVGNREIISVHISAGKTSPQEDIASWAPNPEDLKTHSPPTSHRDGHPSDQESCVSSASHRRSPSSGRKSSVASSQTSSSRASTHQTTDSQVKPEVVRSTQTPPLKPPRKLAIPGDDKPATPPKPSPPKPAVPPRPGSAVKQTVAPKPGPKPVIPSASGKPVPPPRPERSSHSSVPSEIETPDPAMSSSARKQSAAGKPGTCDSTTNSKPVSSPDMRRHSSVSTSGAGGVTSADSDPSGPTCGRESRHSLSSQHEAFLKPLCANNLSISVGVLAERKRSPLPKPRIDKQLNEIELPPRRQLHRSQSDLSSCRHSRTSSDFSDLSSRLSRTSTEVERFFNEMGIDRSVLEPMRRLSETKNKDCQEDLSSLDSLDGNSLSSQMSNDRFPLESEQDLSERDIGPTSIVERNARIIKWLCNVKKAKTSQTRPAKKEPSTNTKKMESESNTK